MINVPDRSNPEARSVNTQDFDFLLEELSGHKEKEINESGQRKMKVDC